MILTFQLDGEEKKIDLPFSLKDISFSQFCDFRGLERQYWDLTGQDEVDVSKAIDKLVEALSCVVKGDLDALPFSGDESYEDLIDRSYQVRPESEISIIHVYAHLVVMIQLYKPELINKTFNWNWNNHKFVMNAGPAARVISGRPLTTNESIEVLEYQRRATSITEENPSETGNIDFNLGLTEMAILLRRPGEKLPTDRRHLTKFIAKRKKIFENINLEEVMNIRFFLLSACVNLLETQTTNSSGTAPLVRIEQEKVTLREKGMRWLRKLGKSTGGESSTK